MTQANGFIFYHGPSQLDRTRKVVGIVTGLQQASQNSKTGAMIQTYILDVAVSPIEAAQTGVDVSICGDCPHRLVNAGTCYVNITQGPTAVWKAWQAGRYPSKGQLPTNATIRLGTYGDPAAIPFEVWAQLLKTAGSRTGYTHQWRVARFQPFKSWCMASCDTPEQTRQAQAAGWRTFTITKHGEVPPIEYKSFLCPASELAGKKLTCAECLACGGLSTVNRASVYIPVHGIAYKVHRFNSLIQIGQ